MSAIIIMRQYWRPPRLGYNELPQVVTAVTDPCQLPAPTTRALIVSCR